MSPLGQGASSDLYPTFGAVLIGAFFQGTLTIQAWNYYEYFPRDSITLKALVLFIWLLDTTHLIIVCQAIYQYTITYWGYQPILTDSKPLFLLIHIIFVGVASFSCQMFFLYRIWIFSRKSILICGTVLSLTLVNLALNIQRPLYLVVNNFTLPQLHIHQLPEGRALFLTGALADIIIAALICYYLSFERNRTDFQGTRTMLGKIIQYSVATGIVTSAAEIAALVVFMAVHNGLYYIAIHFSIGRLYTNSLLAALNARRKFRSSDSFEESPSSQGTKGSSTMQFFKPSNTRSTSHDGAVAASQSSVQASDSQPHEIGIKYTVDCAVERDDSGIDLEKNGEKTRVL